MKAKIEKLGRQFTTPHVHLDLDLFNLGNGCNETPLHFHSLLYTGRESKSADGSFSWYYENCFALVGACCVYYVLYLTRSAHTKDESMQKGWNTGYITLVNQSKVIVPVENNNGAFVTVSEINFGRPERPMQIGFFDPHCGPFARKDLSDYGARVAEMVAPNHWRQRTAIDSLQKDKFAEAFSGVVLGSSPKVVSFSMDAGKITEIDYHPKVVAQALREVVKEDWKTLSSSNELTAPSVDKVAEYYEIYEPHRKSDWADIEVPNLMVK